MLHRRCNRLNCYNPPVILQIRKLNAESESIMADLKAELDDAEAKLRVQARDIDSLSRSKAELEDTVAVR